MDNPSNPTDANTVPAGGAPRALLIVLASAVVGVAVMLSGRWASSAPQPAPEAKGLPKGDIEAYRPRNLSYERIRQIGAIGNLNEGIEITTNGVATRLIAWPGIGVLNGSLHLLTLRPGDASKTYSYPISEEAMVCIKGKGQVLLRGQWVDIEAGDVAYFPEMTTHAVRNAKGNAKDFVLLTQLTPPHLDHYLGEKLLDRTHGRFDYDAIFAAEKKAPRGKLTRELEVHFNDKNPELRASNLKTEDIRRNGALSNIFNGAEFTGIGVPMRIVLFPGFGTRLAGLHCGYVPPGGKADIHTHPISDDMIVELAGKGAVYIDGKLVTIDALDLAIAPVLAWHGGGGGNDPSFRALMIGFGAPAQPELYMRTPYYKDGQYNRPAFSRFEVPKFND